MLSDISSFKKSMEPLLHFPHNMVNRFSGRNMVTLRWQENKATSPAITGYRMEHHLRLQTRCSWIFVNFAVNN